MVNLDADADLSISFSNEFTIVYNVWMPYLFWGPVSNMETEMKNSLVFIFYFYISTM